MMSKMIKLEAAKNLQDEQSTHQDQDLIWGSGLAIFGNILISISLNLQKYVHLRNSKRPSPKHYTKDCLWWLSLALMVTGEGCNFVAYGFAPASLVAPLGTTTVIANLILAALFLKEKPKLENLFGCVLAITGAILLVLFAGQGEKVQGGPEIIESLAQPIFIAYVCIEVLVLAGLLVLLYHFKVHHVVILLLISSLTASFTVISAKAVSGMVQLSVVGDPQWEEPVLYGMILILIVTAVIQIKYLNLAMKDFDATVVVPINFVIFTASAIVAGIIFYKEFLGMSITQIIMFLFGCVLSFVAVYFISLGGRKSASGSSAPLKPESVAADLVPAWMAANVNVGEVQPQGGVEHLKSPGPDNDRTPILASEATELSSGATELSSGATDLGAGDKMGKDKMSVTPMDRERMRKEDGTTYGAIEGGV